MSTRLTDDETRLLLPLMIELARVIQPSGALAERLEFAKKNSVTVRQITLPAGDVDLAKLARFIWAWRR